MTAYNGWTNYATWRVNLEIFDAIDPYDIFPDDQHLWPRAGLSPLVEAIKEYAEGLIYDAGGGDGNIAVDYARAFLQDVNWFEIAEALFLNYADAEDQKEYKNSLYK